MSAHEPRRLVEYGGELRGLLRDALDAERADDGVDPARMNAIEQRIAASIGVAAATATPPHAPPAPPAPRVPAPAPPAPAAATGSWLGAKAPWLVLASAAVIGLGALAYSRTDSAAPASAPTAPRVPSALVADKKPLDRSGGATMTSPATSNVPTLSPADLPEARTTGSTNGAPGKARIEAASAREGEEIALLARAHDALHARPAESLELCRQHETRFASGAFAQEREAVAIEALVYLHRPDEAARRWTAFQSRYPASSHRVHLGSLFSSAPPLAR